MQWVPLTPPRAWDETYDDAEQGGEEDVVVPALPEEALRAGVLLLTKDGERLLVGDVNRAGGACGCCHLSSATRFVAYCVLDVPESYTAVVA